MMYAICCVPVAHVRMMPDHRSEMKSQLLFGEKVTVDNSDIKGWIKITCKADGYDGWCQPGQLREIDAVQYEDSAIVLAADWLNEIGYDDKAMFIPLGSLLSVKEKDIKFSGRTFDPATAQTDEIFIRQIAFKFLSTAYLWGGRSVFGIDCSGFAQAVYKFLNIPLLRDAHLQATQGEAVGFLQEVRCGDLAFFDDEEGQIVHVGILLNEHEIIHASTKVRIDKIDNEGIVNTSTGERTHHLRIIKRYF
ncbi:NlpC/P60 family protein [Ferruginibacter sp. SUN106]|uniref:C40 family peptidase n=1 Tax=Ferruginibacter sp. SUN106 TaxID=2978348 RepID=UPI003D3641E3